MSKILLSLAACLSSFVNIQPSSTLSVSISNIEDRGTLFIGLYNTSSSFGETSRSFRNVKPYATASAKTVSFDRLPEGEYAIAVFQDINGNGKLDKNFFGVPTEPYGFSKNVKPLFSAPTFEDCQFRMTSSRSREMDIELIQP
ncbi:MAG: DUF2141 domain-containing protein [Flavobacteriia bacterium]|nr:DUF2141 domain-containing protein [Flavobacteriia bacterium]